MNNYSKKEKIRIVINFTELLRNYPSATVEKIVIYKSDYSFIEKFKEKSMQWINNEYSSYQGKLYFEEIDKFFEYDFPKSKTKTPKFQLCKHVFAK